MAIEHRVPDRHTAGRASFDIPPRTTGSPAGTPAPEMPVLKADEQAAPASASAPGSLLPNGTLPFEAVSTDGGSFSDNYAVQNMLADDGSVYCSENSGGVNVVLSLPGGAPFTLTRVDVRAPCEGFTSPLGQGLIFISWDYPSERATRLYDGVCSCADYQRVLRGRVDQSGGLGEADPVLFFDLGDYYSTSVSFDVPRSGRYVLIKLLRPRNPHGDNVDVQYVGLAGWTGVRGFPAAELC